MLIENRKIIITDNARRTFVPITRHVAESD